jgi:hypothetical protein
LTFFRGLGKVKKTNQSREMNSTKETRIKNSAEKFERGLKRIGNEKYVLRPYVSGMTPKSTAAIQNTKKIWPIALVRD